MEKLTTDEKKEKKKSDFETKLSEKTENSFATNLSGDSRAMAATPQPVSLTEQIAAAIKDLFYLSEIEAPFETFVWENEAESEVVSTVNPNTVLRFAGKAPETTFREQSITDFFRFPTTEQEWHSEEDKEIVERFAKLQQLIEENLRDAKVYQLGEVEIDIYIVGVNADGNLTGVKTQAVET